MKLIPRQLFAPRDAKSDIVVIMLLRIRQTGRTRHSIYIYIYIRRKISRVCVLRAQRAATLFIYWAGVKKWLHLHWSSQQEFRNDVLTRYLPVWSEILFALSRSPPGSSSSSVHLLLASACLRSPRLRLKCCRLLSAMNYDHKRDAASSFLSPFVTGNFNLRSRPASSLYQWLCSLPPALTESDLWLFVCTWELRTRTRLVTNKHQHCAHVRSRSRCRSADWFCLSRTRSPCFLSTYRFPIAFIYI